MTEENTLLLILKDEKLVYIYIWLYINFAEKVIIIYPDFRFFYLFEKLYL